VTDPKIVKTVLEPVESPAIAAQDMLPTDNEALELAEQELTATKEALGAADADNDALHKQLREAELAIVYLNSCGVRPVVDENREIEGNITEIVMRFMGRPTRPGSTAPKIPDQATIIRQHNDILHQELLARK
jgi:hypothetical protein